MKSEKYIREYRQSHLFELKNILQKGLEGLSKKDIETRDNTLLQLIAKIQVLDLILTP